MSQINGCSTLRGKYPLSQMLAYHLCKILNQQFVPGCYPVIVEGNLFYYVKLKCDNPHESDHTINPLHSGKEKNKQKQAERIQSNLYPEISNIFQSRSG